jgi:hypothetical protein
MISQIKCDEGDFTLSLWVSGVTGDEFDLATW